MIGSMNVEELKSKMDNNFELILIDVREQAEYDEARIKGSRLYPLSSFSEFIGKLENKNATIVLQCRSGKRSLTAGQMLEAQGFQNLFNLEGGILAWKEAGFEVES